MKSITSLAFIVLLICLGGCASGPVGYQAFEAKPGTGVVYVYRLSKIAASGVSADVLVDGKVVGQIPNGSYLASFVGTGEHVVEVKFGIMNKLWYKDQKRTIRISENTKVFLRLDLELTSLTVVGPYANSTWDTGLGEVPESVAIVHIAKLGINNNPVPGVR